MAPRKEEASLPSEAFSIFGAVIEWCYARDSFRTVDHAKRTAACSDHRGPEGSWSSELHIEVRSASKWG